MTYYEISDNTCNERDWTVAVGIRTTSHAAKWHCQECGRSGGYPAGSFDVVLEGGSKFPDFLECAPYPLLIVSDRVTFSLEQAGMLNFLKFPVGIEAIQESILRKEAAPKYFRIEVTGECMVDFLASGITISGACCRCGELERNPLTVRSLQILEGSWDGSDLFRDRRCFPRIILCTNKIVDIVQSTGLTNALFKQQNRS